MKTEKIFYPLRDDKKTAKQQMKLIRAKCLDCSAGSKTEVRLCRILECPLWIHRMGRKASDKDTAKLNAFYKKNNIPQI